MLTLASKNITRRLSVRWLSNRRILLSKARALVNSGIEVENFSSNVQMCDEYQLYTKCVRDFLSPCNTKRIATELALDHDLITREANQWIAPQLAREADFHPVLINEMFI